MRGFSWKPKPAAKPAPAREVPTVQLEEEVGADTPGESRWHDFLVGTAGPSLIW